jgi:hypothetical protein
MASELELRVQQKRMLFKMLKLEKMNIKAGVTVLGLREDIIAQETEMSEEDVAYVQKQIAKLDI